MLEGHDGPKATLWRNIRVHSRGFSSFPYVPCDPLAAAVLLDPHAVVEVKLRHVQVELQGSITRGQTIIDWGHLNDGQPNCFVVTKFNLNVFKALLKRGLLS
jgi:inosine-uridine nucleoside N-ribohydrolase